MVYRSIRGMVRLTYYERKIDTNKIIVINIKAYSNKYIIYLNINFIFIIHYQFFMYGANDKT